MCAFVDSRAAAYEQRLAAAYPNRAHLITPAIRAHVQGEYALSTPVFLSQADGICFDGCGGQLYQVRELEKLVDKLGLPGSDWALAPLTGVFRMRLGSKDRQGPMCLVRHSGSCAASRMSAMSVAS